MMKARRRDMTNQATAFDNRFTAVFDGGVADIKFFVRKAADLSVESLREELLEFQLAVDDGKVERVTSVDHELPQVDFESAW
jgi:hypothetical protein